MGAEFQDFLQLLTGGSPALASEARSGTQAGEPLNGSIAVITTRHRLEPQRSDLVRSLLLLWHDHLDESHAISQNISTPDGSYVHGLVHRREPDYGNAKYWFQRVGHHPIFPLLTRVMQESDALPPFTNRQADWDPFAFIDFCEKARAGHDSQAVKLAVHIQESEFRLLLKHFCER